MAVLPIVFARFGVNPHSVIDVGCGDGGWLRAAGELGVRRLVGVDRGPEPKDFPGTYMQVDLEKDVFMASRPLEYDLAICLEVAEHLRPLAADRLVVALARLAPVLLFSAAQPGQGPYPPVDAPAEELGKWHINEQTPQFWGLEFRRQGYEQRELHDIRRDQRVDPWYRSNTFLYVKTAVGVRAAAVAAPAPVREEA